jgi:hypothetical protein
MDSDRMKATAPIYGNKGWQGAIACFEILFKVLKA